MDGNHKPRYGFLSIFTPFSTFPAGRLLCAKNRYLWSPSDHKYLFLAFPPAIRISGELGEVDGLTLIMT
jgi:hypothetical protein